MAQTGYTPILIYSSSTASQAPAAGNLTNSTLGSELAININDGKLFYKDSGNNVQVIAWKTTPTSAGGTGLTSYTAGDLLYYATGTTLSKLAIGASKTILTSSGTAPQWSASLDTTQGGTGLTSYTAGDIPYFATGTALSKLAIGANTYILASDGTAPTWVAPSSVSIGTATNLSGGAQGSIPYQSNASTTAFLAKDTNATRYLANTGTNNNPAWAQINLADGVTGTLPVGNGGTGITSGTSGGIPYFSATTTIASSALLTANALMVGGGAGAAPSTVTTGTGVLTALAVNTGTAGAFVVNGGALGTPSSGTVTNLTGTASININGTVGATTKNTARVTSIGIGSATNDSMTISGSNPSGTSYQTVFQGYSGTQNDEVIWELKRTAGGAYGEWKIINGNTSAVYFSLPLGSLTGDGQLNPDSAQLSIKATTFPQADNTYTMGKSGYKWKEIWSNNGTIQTSDARKKTDVQDSDLGLAFINSLRPVSYKWILGQNVVEIDQVTGDKTITAQPGKRRHYGLISQEVKSALGEKDFAGYIHDEKADEFGLRYEQFIAPLIKAVQELSARVAELEAK